MKPITQLKTTNLLSRPFPKASQPCAGISAIFTLLRTPSVLVRTCRAAICFSYPGGSVICRHKHEFILPAFIIRHNVAWRSSFYHFMFSVPTNRHDVSVILDHMLLLQWVILHGVFVLYKIRYVEMSCFGPEKEELVGAIFGQNR